MKIILRLLILLIVAFIIFTGGFWLGNKWKGNDSATPAEDMTAEIPAPGGTQPKDGALEAPPVTEATAPEAVPKSPAAGAPEKSTKDSATKTEEAMPAPSPSDEPAPVAGPAAGPGEKPSAGQAGPATETPKTEAEPEKPKTEVATGPQPTPEAPPPPAEGEESSVPPTDEAEKKKEGPPAIVTPQDLGENQITYSIQTGAFLEKSLAQNQIELLKSKKYPAFLVSAWDAQKQLWHTVRVGRFTNILEARKAAEALRQKERLPARVYGLGSLQYEEPPVLMETARDDKPKTTPPKAATNGADTSKENSG